ncbi:MAG: PilZ domain-containing protein [Oligoflexia bacterium]|nr:PilZ domain-containing protein [Oligoflexia bacterium]MBF0365503.1 PilZ domain-containing protein [Oligoflexia bacterium]
MERQFVLLKSDHSRQEKRILPRFPYSFLTFKCKEGRTFEVSDLSLEGMQLALRDGDHQYKVNDQLGGVLHWQGQEITLAGKVKWRVENRFGMKFTDCKDMRGHIRELLSPRTIVDHLRPVHSMLKTEIGLEIPRALRYWLQAGRILEIFVWQYQHGELSHFHILMLDNFVEWVDGLGIKTGKTLSKRKIETPLNDEDELVLSIDNECNQDKVVKALEIVNLLSAVKHIPQEVIDFMKVKLS